MTTQQRRLELLQKNAPLLYPSYVAKRKNYIEARLEELRIKYKNETEEGKKRVLNEVAILKQELALLTSGDLETPTPTDETSITSDGERAGYASES